MRRFILACFAVLALACSARVEPAGRADESIINGTRETGYPEVVALYWSSGATEGGLCSGTVIGPYAVLTAKHCVFRDRAGGGQELVPASEMLVLVGHDVNVMSGVTSAHRVLEVRTTAGSNIDDDVENGNDIAVVLLDAAIPVTSRAFATSGPSTGQSLTIVGFGRTSAVSDASGVKYRATTRTDRVGDRLFETDGTGAGWTCQGDSGGPAIDPAGSVTGITSFGIGGCNNPYSYFTRVAWHRALIDAALTFVPPCVPVAEECNDRDDDCDGEIDETRCAAQGAPCEASSDCIDGSCEDVGGARICAAGCFADDPSLGSCPAGSFCEATMCGIGRCIPGTLGTAPEGTECTAHTECASGNCSMVAGAMRCGRQCFAERGCDAGLVCEIESGDCGACIPAELSTRPRAFGAPCSGDAQCESGDCSAEGYCTSACGSHAECPADHHCGAGACLRGAPAAAGGACAADDDCATGLGCSDSVCAAGSSGGGGCAVAPPSSSSFSIAMPGMLALAWLAMRRRTRR